MQLNMHKNWQNFDDYLQSLKTKFRVKARKALQQSADLKVVKINEEKPNIFIK
ncbi:MAG: hypothetical protein HC798_03385 [Polaribacter sp.]|nr:hypothetical protein [Polaribacter sp.]